MSSKWVSFLTSETLAIAEKPIFQYVFSIAVAGMALTLSAVLHMLLGGERFAPFLIGTGLVLAVYGIRGAAVSATASALGTLFLFVSSPQPLPSLDNLTVFLISAVLILGLVHGLRRARLAADQARQEAEAMYLAEASARRVAEAAQDRISRLFELTASLSRANTLQEAANVMMAKAIPAVGSTVGAVALLTPDRKAFHCLRMVRWPLGNLQKTPVLPVDAAFPISDSMRMDKPTVVRSLTECEARYPQLKRVQKETEVEFHAVVAVPMRVEGQLVGAFGVAFVEDRSLPAEEIEYISAVAEQCAQALHRVRSYEMEREARGRAEEAGQRLALLAQIGEMLAYPQGQREMFETVTRLATPSLGDWCAVVARNDDGSLTDPIVTHRNSSQEDAYQTLLRRLDRHRGMADIKRRLDCIETTADRMAQTEETPLVEPLTAREVEVLSWLAQGMTNAQIAERLIISPYTVNMHLRSIYGKLGVSNRSSATRYALEHHLAA